jgi:hypothetical protein
MSTRVKFWSEFPGRMVCFGSYMFAVDNLAFAAKRLERAFGESSIFSWSVVCFWEHFWLGVVGQEVV